MPMIVLSMVLLGCVGKNCPPPEEPCADERQGLTCIECGTTSATWGCGRAYVGEGYEWYESDIPCFCVTEDGERDTAVEGCRSTH